MGHKQKCEHHECDVDKTDTKPHINDDDSDSD